MLDHDEFDQFCAGRGRYDLPEIKRWLGDSAESWVPRLFPNGRRVGNTWRLANIRGDAPRKNGSCVIDLVGPHAGGWYEHEDGSCGDAIDTVGQATVLRGRELFAYAAELTGLSSGATAPHSAPWKPSPDRDATAEIDHILAGARPIRGSPAERYLTGRGLSALETSDLLFHPDAPFWEAGGRYPAMVAVVRNAEGARVGVQLTYLSEDSAGRVAKAEVSAPRKSRGVRCWLRRPTRNRRCRRLARALGRHRNRALRHGRQARPAGVGLPRHRGSPEGRGADGDPPDRDPLRQRRVG